MRVFHVSWEPNEGPRRLAVVLAESRMDALDIMQREPTFRGVLHWLTDEGPATEGVYAIDRAHLVSACPKCGGYGRVDGDCPCELRPV